MSFGGEIRNAFCELSKFVVGWNEILVQAMFGLCTREHVFWLGPPGRAKTWVAKMIFGMFPDARSFYIQVTKDMMPSAVFGNEIPREYLETGREIFNLEGGICTAHFVYLDEFLDGPDFLIRALNTVLNERRFERKDQRVDVPLHSGIMTTNFDRYGLALEAVRDRMMCKAAVPSVGGLAGRMDMYHSYLSYVGSLPPLPQLSFADLQAFAGRVESPNGVAVPDYIRLLHGLLIKTYTEKRIERERARLKKIYPDRDIRDDEIKLEPVTPRTEAKLHDFSRAAALLNDRREVEPKDLRALRYGLVTINTESGDEQTWEEVCREYLPGNTNQIKRLKQLAVVANKVAELQRLGEGFKDTVLQIAGKAETYTRVTIIELLDKIAGNEGAGVMAASQVLKDDIKKLCDSVPTTRFPWKNDWS